MVLGLQNENAWLKRDIWRHRHCCELSLNNFPHCLCMVFTRLVFSIYNCRKTLLWFIIGKISAFHDFWRKVHLFVILMITNSHFCILMRGNLSKTLLTKIKKYITMQNFRREEQIFDSYEEKYWRNNRFRFLQTSSNVEILSYN